MVMSEPQKAYEEAAHSHAHISPMLGIPGEPDPATPNYRGAARRRSSATIKQRKSEGSVDWGTGAVRCE